MSRLDHPAAFLESAPLLPLELDGESGLVRYVGPQAGELLGYPVDAWYERGFWHFAVVPDDQKTMADARRQSLDARGRHAVDYRMERADGRVIWVSEHMSCVDDDGPLLRGFLLDVTHRKRQEILLWKNEERLRTLLRKAPDAMVLTAYDGTVLNLNDQAEALFDYRLADIAGSYIDHLLPERLRSRLADLRAAFDRDPDRRSLVDGHSFAIQRADGTEIPVELSLSLIQGGDDERCILWSVRDLTVRRRVEAQLRSSERRFQEIADVFPAMVCFLDVDSRYRFVNEAYAQWYGWGRRQLEGRSLREVIGEGLFSQIEPSIDAALGGVATHFRGEVTDATGTPLPVDVNVVPQHDDTGEVVGYSLVAFDISQEIASREADQRDRAELAHVSRVATLGELAASIAHELNQPLSAIVAKAQAGQRFLKRAAESDPELEAAESDPELEAAEGHADLEAVLTDIAADAFRAGEVISSMRELLERTEPRAEALDLAALIESVVTLLRGEAIGRGVTIEVDVDAGLPALFGDRIQLQQLLINLLMNAIEATARPTSGPRHVRICASARQDQVELSVRDSGPGLPADDPEELFAPFVPRTIDGIGMGLAISRTIAEAHGGTLWAERNEPSGAAFTLCLPVTRP